MLGAPDDAGHGGLPDLFERLERIATLCIALALSAYVPLIFGHDVLFYGVWIVAIMTQITAVQRFVRRARQLRKIDLSEGPP